MAEIELPEVEELEERMARPFTRRVALITGIFAVLLAITALGGKYAMKEMILAQQQAADQWAFYQAKNLRENFYRSQKLRLEMELFERAGTMRPEVQKRFEEEIKKSAQEESRLYADKKKIEKEARHLEHERDLYRTKDPYFDYGEALLQISIIMASVAILAHSGGVLAFALAIAGLGTLLSLNGFFLFFRLPFFH